MAMTTAMSTWIVCLVSLGAVTVYVGHLAWALWQDRDGGR